MKNIFISFVVAASFLGSAFVAYAEETPPVQSVQPAPSVQTMPQVEQTQPTQSVQPISSNEQNQNVQPQPVVLKNIAEEANSAAEVQEPAKKPVKDPSIELTNKINAFIIQKNLRSNGRQIFSGISVINQPISHPDYAKYRVFAYEEAYLSALTTFFKSVALDIKAETEQKVFNDQSSNRAKFEEELNEEQTSFSSVIDKTLALTGAKLDAALKEYGIDPAQYNAAPADQKKTMLSNAFTQKIVQRFSKSLGGVTTLQTFFMNNEEGTGAVGVIIAYSPKIESVAEALKIGKKPAIDKTGKPLAQLLPLDNSEKLSTMLGTRLLIDEYGPVIVAFGQWANSSVSEDPAIRAEYRNAAFEQASAMAFKEISAFLNQSYTAEIETERSKILNEFAVKEGKTGMITEQKEREIIDKVFRQAQAHTSSYLQGAQTLTQWIYQTPEGHEMVGVVVSYSFNDIMKAKTMFDKEPNAGTQNVKKEYDPSYEEGAVTMDLDTF